MGVYFDPGRDPRGHVVSIAYLAELSESTKKPCEEGILKVKFFREIPKTLAFDHLHIIKDALTLAKRLKMKCPQFS